MWNDPYNFTIVSFLVEWKEKSSHSRCHFSGKKYQSISLWVALHNRLDKSSWKKNVNFCLSQKSGREELEKKTRLLTCDEFSIFNQLFNHYRSDGLKGSSLRAWFCHATFHYFVITQNILKKEYKIYNPDLREMVSLSKALGVLQRPFVGLFDVHQVMDNIFFSSR